MKLDAQDQQAAIGLLNTIMETELAGVVRYTHYALMVYGYNRIPIVSWLKDNATESLAQAQRAGELLTMLGGHPSLQIGTLLETRRHDIGDILRESLDHERSGLDVYHQLLDVVANKSIILEEFARAQIAQEEAHVDQVNKMLRRPGDLDVFEG